MTDAFTVGVLGAGAVGCYLGLRLSAAGTRVILVGRKSLVERRAALRVVTLDGREVSPGEDLVVTDEARALEDADVCLVTVKSRDSAEAAALLGGVLPGDAVVVSFQNGLRNAARLRSALTHTVVAGMVSYNVHRDGDVFRQLTSGPLVAGTVRPPASVKLDALARAFAEAGQPLDLHDDVGSVLAGKLLLNLNNGLCALTGTTIAESLANRDHRWCFAQVIKEGARVMRVADLRPARVVALPAPMIARLLPLPDAIFLRAAKSMVTIDPRAKLSTLVDLLAGKPTEIDDLNGEIAALAMEHGVPAPVNAFVTAAVHELEARAPALPFIPATELRRRIEGVLERSAA